MILFVYQTIQLSNWCRYVMTIFLKLKEYLPVIAYIGGYICFAIKQKFQSIYWKIEWFVTVVMSSILLLLV